MFNAIAEPRRRRIVEFLARGVDCDVGQIARHLRLPQPSVSKHLGVLRKVGVVAVHKAGQRRLYRLDPQELKPVHDWIGLFDRFWDGQLAAIKETAERVAAQEAARGRGSTEPEPPTQEIRHDR